MGSVAFSHVVLGGTRSAPAEAFWSAALGGAWRAAGAADGWDASLVPHDGDPYVHRSARAGATALVLEVDEVGAAVVRLVALGATWSDTAGPTTLGSPGGLPFTLLPARSTRRPAPCRWPDGSSSRLVQVCLDCPADRAGTEARFWAAATGWSRRPSGSREFVGHLVPDAGPLQLLVQRLDSAATAVGAHLDLGTSDREAEAARLVRLGATRLATGSGWIVLADPDGRAFCATGQPPDAPP